MSWTLQTVVFLRAVAMLPGGSAMQRFICSQQALLLRSACRLQCRVLGVLCMRNLAETLYAPLPCAPATHAGLLLGAPASWRLAMKLLSCQGRTKLR